MKTKGKENEQTEQKEQIFKNNNMDSYLRSVNLWMLS